MQRALLSFLSSLLLSPLSILVKLQPPKWLCSIHLSFLDLSRAFPPSSLQFGHPLFLSVYTLSSLSFVSVSSSHPLYLMLPLVSVSFVRVPLHHTILTPHVLLNPDESGGRNTL